MRKIMAIAVLALFCCAGSVAQTKVKQNGNVLEQVSNKSNKPQDTKTDLVFKDSKGKTYPVYKTAKGKYYVIRTSAKTGKEYKQYIQIEK